MIKITGDRHGNFSDLIKMSKSGELTSDDVVILLGDAGLNYFGDNRDSYLKLKVNNCGFKLFCIHGNHERRPSEPTYKKVEFMGGQAWCEPEFENLIFAIDGEVYNFGGMSTLVIGGAYSVDKYYRLARGARWFSDEQPSEEVKKHVEEVCANRDWNVDVVLSHTSPIKYEPREWFLAGVDQSTVDNSTEKWLDTIEDKLDYKKWYVGHYHGEKVIDKMRFMFGTVEPFYSEL